jgi:hemerythrin-like domain-containing protein
MAHTHAVPVSAVVPGHRAPAAGVEAPFELLAACHDRVRRSLDLLERLQIHVATKGCDDDARSAATDVMRYFDIAAPLHHQDEELHVFPVVLRGQDIFHQALVRKLQLEHIEMHNRWQVARRVLERIAETYSPNAPPLHEEQLQALHSFLTLYSDHMENEEFHIYPAAASQLSPGEVATMGTEMGARRGLHPHQAQS